MALTGVLHEVAGADEAVVLVHGLGGNSHSHYMLRGAASSWRAGLSVLRLNLRGADRSGEDFYHAGLTADLHGALASPQLARYRRLYLLGYSMGGHLVLRAATEPADPRLAAVAAACSPLDLELSSRALDRPPVWPYRRYLLAKLVDLYSTIAARRRVPLPLGAAALIRKMREWDERIVAPYHGFTGASDYYSRVSVAGRLSRLLVPALLVNAEHDPMVPAAAVRAVLAVSPPRLLEVRWARRGGHVGFPAGLDLGLGGGPGLEAQVLAWLRRQ